MKFSAKKVSKSVVFFGGEENTAVDSEKVLKHVDKDNTLKSRINKGDTIY